MTKDLSKMYVIADEFGEPVGYAVNKEYADLFAAAKDLLTALSAVESEVNTRIERRLVDAALAKARGRRS